MKRYIPIKTIETISIELVEYTRETGYSCFYITFNGITKTSLKITGETINKIYAETNKIIKEV